MNPSLSVEVIPNGRLSHVQRRLLLRRSILMKQFKVKDKKELRRILGPSCLFKDEGAILKSLTYPVKCRRRFIKNGNRKTQVKFKEDANLVKEITYTDSTTFLKGNQSSNPHNDYCQHFVDTGDRPQNFIRDTGLKHRFEEYPKLRELIRLKDEQISKTATPPMYLKCDLNTLDLNTLEGKFDVIYIDPPLEEYNSSNGVSYDRYWSWKEIERLKIEDIAAQRSFCWIWCGSGEGLDEARKCLQKWGFRRCEDICWIKTNRTRSGHKNLEGDAVFQRTKEHCLMGIKGTVKRSVDGDFIHANVDIDLIIDEEPPYGVKEKPIEIFHIMEHFCLGRRRIHVFGRDSTIRPGWLTVGSELASSNFNASIYQSYFINQDSSGFLTGCTEEIERLRPKSPPPKQKVGENRNNDGGGGGGGGISGSMMNDNSNWNSILRDKGPSGSSGLPYVSMHSNYMHHPSTALASSVMFSNTPFLSTNLLSPLINFNSGGLLSNIQRNLFGNYGLLPQANGGMLIPHNSKGADGSGNFPPGLYFKALQPFPTLLSTAATNVNSHVLAGKCLWPSTSSSGRNLPDSHSISHGRSYSRNRDIKR